MPAWVPAAAGVRAAPRSRERKAVQVSVWTLVAWARRPARAFGVPARTPARASLRVRAGATAKGPEWAQQAWVATRPWPLAVVPGAGLRSTQRSPGGRCHWSPLEGGVVVLDRRPVGAAAVWPRASRPAWGRRTLRWAAADELALRVLGAGRQANPVRQACPVRRMSPVLQMSHSAAVWPGLWRKLGQQAPSPGPGPRRRRPCPPKVAPAH